MKKLIAQEAGVGRIDAEQRTELGQSRRLTLARNSEPLGDQPVEAFIDLGFDHNDAQPVRKPNDRKQIALRVRRTTVVKVRSAFDMGIDQFGVAPFGCLVQDRPHVRQNFIGQPPLIDEAFRRPPFLPMMRCAQMGYRVLWRAERRVNAAYYRHAARTGNVARMLNTPAPSA